MSRVESFDRQRWATLELAKRLAERGLRAEDVISLDGMGMFLPRSGTGVAQGLTWTIDRQGVCGPPPEPLFTVGRGQFWLFDDIIGWLAPLLDKRGEVKLRMEDRAERSAAWWTREAAGMPHGPPGSSGFYGVTINRVTGRWRANRIPAPRRTALMREFDTPEEAARAVDRVRIEDGYPPLNFPDDVETTRNTPHPRDLPARITPTSAYGDAVRAVLEATGEVTQQTVARQLEATIGRAPSAVAISSTLKLLANKDKLRRVRLGHYVAGPNWSDSPTSVSAT